MCQTPLKNQNFETSLQKTTVNTVIEKTACKILYGFSPGPTWKGHEFIAPSDTQLSWTLYNYDLCPLLLTLRMFNAEIFAISTTVWENQKRISQHLSPKVHSNWSYKDRIQERVVQLNIYPMRCFCCNINKRVANQG